jgi:hypothetical protein
MGRVFRTGNGWGADGGQNDVDDGEFVASLGVHSPALPLARFVSFCLRSSESALFRHRHPI